MKYSILFGGDVALIGLVFVLWAAWNRHAP